jgi:exosortase A-associated hydrolase 1
VSSYAIGPEGAMRVAVLHRPDRLRGDTGLVVVVGGPQYRVGSHRQFVLLARWLSAHGVPVLRFDLTGMGDSVAPSVGFEAAGPDIRQATDLLLREVVGLRGVALWGLCDGASAALMNATDDPRVRGLVLLNPWVRTDEGLAQAYLDNYYGRRLRNAAFWRKVCRSPSLLLRSAGEYLRNRLRARGARNPVSVHFIRRMYASAASFGGPMLVLLSGQDTVAAEFEGLLARSRAWGDVFAGPNVKIRRLEAANHTFSRREWRDWVAAETCAFVTGLGDS